MRRGEILERANQRAAGRYGITISDHMLSDLLESKVVTTPAQRGRVRIWTRRQYREILEIARLNKLGMSSHNEIRWILWLKRRPGISVKFDQRNRTALAIKYDQIMSATFRGIRSTYPEVRNSKPTGNSARRVISGMGPLDDCFAGIIKYQAAESLVLYRSMRHGEQFQATIYERVMEEIATWIAARRLGWIGARIPVRLLIRPIARLTAPLLTTVARQPEATSSGVAKSVLAATPGQFEHARRIVEVTILMFRWLGLQKIAASLLQPKWRFLALAVTVHVVRAFPDAGVSLLSAQELEAIEAYLSR